MSIHYSSFPRKQKSLHPKALLEVESQKARMRKSGRGREKGKTLGGVIPSCHNPTAKCHWLLSLQRPREAASQHSTSLSADSLCLYWSVSSDSPQWQVSLPSFSCSHRKGGPPWAWHSWCAGAAISPTTWHHARRPLACRAGGGSRGSSQGFVTHGSWAIAGAALPRKKDKWPRPGYWIFLYLRKQQSFFQNIQLNLKVSILPAIASSRLLPMPSYPRPKLETAL